MDRILFIFGNDTLPNDINMDDTKKLFEIAGGNVGNFVYKHYLKSYLQYDKQLSKDILNVNELNQIEDIDSKFDKCVVICANQVSIRDKALLPFYDFFKSTKLPIILLGLGAQSDLNYSMNFLDNIPEHIKLLKMLSDKKAIIGCRGQFSYNVLKKIGFKKVFIIGCPSFYKNGLNLKITKKEANKDLLVDVTFEWMKNREIWYNIIKFIPNFHVICQSAPETALFNLSLNKETSDDIKLLENLFNIKQNNIIKDKPIFKNRVSLFFDIEKWEDFINHRDFYIGPKIHGCLMHILNGKPGFLIVHDSRTREFAELFGIPHISSFEISSTLDIYEIYNTYSPKKLEKKYNNLFYNYLCFLDMCNLKYNFSNFTTKNKITLLIYKLKFYINNFFMPKLSLYCNTIIRKKISNNKKIIKFFGVEFFKQKKQNFKIYNYFLGIKFYTSFDLQGYIDNRITSLSNEILIIKDKINQLEKHKNMK